MDVLISKAIYEIRCACGAKLFISPVEWEEVQLRYALVHIKCRRCKSIRFIAPIVQRQDYSIEEPEK